MSFDPNAFLNATFEGANDTKVTPPPVGEYLAIADKVEVKTWSSRDGSASGLKLNIIWDIQDEGVLALLDRKKVSVRQDIMLDLTDSGQLDMGKGKNTRLGRLREAVDLNDPSRPFSFAMVQGRPAKVSVSHRVDGQDIYAEVKEVAKA